MKAPYEQVKTIECVLAENPTLTLNGFDYSGQVVRAPLNVRRRCWEEDESRQQIATAMQWLQLVNKTRHARARRGFGSYGLKHDVERWSRPSPDGPYRYVSNGAFIVAALCLGFEIYRDLRSGPNCVVGITKRSHDRVCKISL